MPLTIYGMAASCPTRAVVLTAKALGIPYNYKIVNILNGENKTPEYLKLNPTHTLPTIDDNGTVIFDSHAIVAYLSAKYGKDDSLYPTKDLVKKAIVDQRLHYDSSKVFPRVQEHVFKAFFGDCVITEDIQQRTEEALADLQSCLGDHDWIAHTPKFTVADICLLSTIETLITILPYLDKFPKLQAWRNRASAKIPSYKETIDEGNAPFIQAISSKLKKA